MEIIKNILFLYMVVFIGVVFLWRIFIVWKKTGVFPITHGAKRDLHDILGKIFAILIALSLCSAIVYIFFETYYRYLLPIKFLELTVLKIAGLVVAWLSMFWTILAQAQMGTSWRIGIDRVNETELVVAGLYRYIKHPIYVGLSATSLALFLIMPNILSLIVLLSTPPVLRIQARLEEKFLKNTHQKEVKLP